MSDRLAANHSRFIPRECAGETMSMDLTEPDAGSDLQRVMFKATYSEKMAQNFVFQKIYLTLFFLFTFSIKTDEEVVFIK